MNSDGRFKSPSWKRANPALEPQLYLIVVKDVVAFVNRLGFNPVYPEYLRYANNLAIQNMDTAVGKSTHVTNAMGTDLMWFLITTFAAQLIHLSEAWKGLKRDEKQSYSAGVLRHTLRDKLSEHDCEDLPGLMTRWADGFDMLGILAPPEFAQTLELPEVGNVMHFTHSLCNFSRAVLDADWKREEADMGLFCQISHVTQLLRKDIDVNSARSGGSENANAGAGTEDDDLPGEGKRSGQASGEEEEKGASGPSSGEKKRKRKPRKRKKTTQAGTLEGEGESSTEPSSATGLALLGTASQARQALEPFRSLDEPLPNLDGASEDIDGSRRQFQSELDQLSPVQFRDFRRVLHMMKHSEDRSGNGAGGGGGDDEDGLGKSRKHVGNPFVLDEAECRTGSADEEENDRECETQADTDFISDAHQENNTDTSHRQCDNLDRSREGPSVEQERGLLIEDGNEQTDWWEEAFIFDAEDQQEPPDYDGFRHLF